MEAEQAFQEFRRLKETLPFRPFEVETADGKRFCINRRSGFAAGKTTVVLADAADQGRFYKHSDVTLIRDSTPPVAT